MNFTSETDKGILVITPHLEPGGDVLQLRRLKDAVVKQHKPDMKAVLLDLSDIDFIDSGVIGAVVGSCRFLNQKNCAFAICGVGLRVAETLYIMNLHRALPIRMRRADAMTDLEKATMRDGAMEALLAKNPSIDSVRKWWMESALTREAVPKLPVEPPKPPPAPTPVPVVGVSDADNALALSKCEAAQDWLRALRLFREAKTLGARYGLAFSANMTFRDFLSEMADRLEPQGEDTGGG